MMKCLKCAKKAFYNGLCRGHFTGQIESRVKRDIRGKGLIKKDDVLAADAFSAFFIKKIVSGMPLKFVKNARKDAKTVSQSTLDDEVMLFLQGFFGEKTDIEGQANEIKPFRTVKEDELIAYSKISRVKFKKKKRSRREEEIKKALEKIENLHQETKFSLLKGVEEIKSLR